MPKCSSPDNVPKRENSESYFDWLIQQLVAERRREIERLTADDVLNVADPIPPPRGFPDPHLHYDKGESEKGAGNKKLVVPEIASFEMIGRQSTSPRKSTRHQVDQDVAFEENAQPRNSCASYASSDSGTRHAQSRSTFSMKLAEEEKFELQTYFLCGEGYFAASSGTNKGIRYVWERLQNSSKQEVEMYLETVVLVLICLNALFIGVSMDKEDDASHWFAIDVTFFVLFLLEIILKILLNGWRNHFLGPCKYMNIFDFTLVFIDFVQILLEVSSPSSRMLDTTPSASLFRIIRLFRLARLLRILKVSATDSLASMLHGMMGGLPTLMWSLMLIVIVTYAAALVSREYLGKGTDHSIREQFYSVPRALFTTFRCAFGDCNDSNGAPIFDYVDRTYGTFYSIFYCLFVFIMTMGLFNVVSAIFVESTLEAAQSISHEAKKARLKDETLWSTRITTLVRSVSPRCLTLSNQSRRMWGQRRHCLQTNPPEVISHFLVSFEFGADHARQLIAHVRVHLGI